MKAITVKQPYATLIIDGAKLIENRVRKSPWSRFVGERIAVHAGKSTSMIAHADAYDVSRMQPMGVVLGTVFLEAVYHISEIQSGKVLQESHRQLASHKHLQGPWCLVLKDPEKFTDPIPAVGHLGVWDWNE